MSKALTQAQTTAALADASGSSKADVKAVLDALQKELTQNDKVATSFGIFTKKVKPARAARKGTNPFTGEEMMFKAKPAETQLKFRANKATKELLN